jgi:tetratricopeptide (TPR) repeat protein
MARKRVSMRTSINRDRLTSLVSGVMAGILAAMGLLAFLAGCATPAGDTPQAAIAQWQCDPAADEAMRTGDEETGLRLHQQFVARHPDNPLAHYHLGYAFGRSGEIEAEIDHYEKAVSLGYDANDQLYFNLGMAYRELNHTDQAMTAFERVIEIDPHAVDAMLELARLRQQTGDKQGAYRLLQKAEALEPENEFVRQWLKALEKVP